MSYSEWKELIKSNSKSRVLWFEKGQEQSSLNEVVIKGDHANRPIIEATVISYELLHCTTHIYTRIYTVPGQFEAIEQFHWLQHVAARCSTLQHVQVSVPLIQYQDQYAPSTPLLKHFTHNLSCVAEKMNIWINKCSTILFVISLPSTWQIDTRPQQNHLHYTSQSLELTLSRFHLAQ